FSMRIGDPAIPEENICTGRSSRLSARRASASPPWPFPHPPAPIVSAAPSAQAFWGALQQARLSAGPSRTIRPPPPPALIRLRPAIIRRRPRPEPIIRRLPGLTAPRLRPTPNSVRAAIGDAVPCGWRATVISVGRFRSAPDAQLLESRDVKVYSSGRLA